MSKHDAADLLARELTERELIDRFRAASSEDADVILAALARVRREGDADAETQRHARP